MTLRPRLNFRVASMLTVMVLVAICYRFADLIFQQYWTSSIVLLTFVFTLAGWLCSRWLFVTYVDENHQGSRAKLVSTLFCLCAASVVLVACLRIRWNWIFWDPQTPRPFPFPDHALLSFHDWLDAMNPAPPGSLKIHGEYYTVLAYLTYALIALSALTGTILAMLTPQSWPRQPLNQSTN